MNRRGWTASPKPRARRWGPDPTAAWKAAREKAEKQAIEKRLLQHRRLEEAKARSAALIAQRRALLAERKKKLARYTPPSKRAGIRAWEQYYQRTSGKSLTPRQRQSIERYDKQALYQAVRGKRYVPKEFSAISRTGVRSGITWMFGVAYQGRDMPYWDLWYDRKKTADEIARMVANDYQTEIRRRKALQEVNKRVSKVWEEQGRIGPVPTIDPHAVPDTSTPKVLAPPLEPPELKLPTSIPGKLPPLGGWRWY